MGDKTFFLNMAFELAKINLGSTKDNPSVGCIIEKNNTVLSSGFTSLNGRPHAEYNALNKKLNFKNSNMYVTLEPCSHYGKTPPCINIIKKKKIKNVYFSFIDQDLRSKNKSGKNLKKNKITVKKSILKKKGKEFYSSYYIQHTSSIPYIDAKIAISKDFYTKNLKKKFITNENSRLRGNFLRSMYDCLISTSKSINSDNAMLNCRIKGFENKSPDLIILDRNLKIKKNLGILRKKTKRRIYLFTTKRDKNKINFLKRRGIKIRFLKSLEDKKDFIIFFRTLKNMGYNRVFVEAGFTFLNFMLKIDLINNLYVFQSKDLFKNFGLNIAKNKVFKSMKHNNRVKVNLKGDNLYKIKVKTNV